MRRSSIAAGAVLALLLTAAPSVHAQAWLADRNMTEGRGLRAGRFEFHPGLGVEFGYDSNLLGCPPDNPPICLVTPALRLRVTPSISMNTLGSRRLANPGADTATVSPPTLDFQAQLALVYNQFFSISGPPHVDVTPYSNVGVNAGFRLGVFPQGTWRFNLADDFARITTGEPSGGVPNTAVTNRDQNQGFAEVVFAPNSGGTTSNVLDLRLSYTNTLTFFETGGFGIFSNMGNLVTFRSRWKFFPQTALLFDTSISPTIYLNTSGSSTGLFTSFPVTARLGLNGLLTDRFGITAMVGYYGSYYNLGDNISTGIALAEIRYIFSPQTSFRLGFQRDGQAAYYGNYVMRNRGYVGINQYFFGRLYINAEFGGGYYQFGYIATPTGTPDTGNYSGTSVDSAGRYSAVRLEGLAFAEYRFTDYFGINLTGVVSANLTDTTVTLGPSVQESLAWTKGEVYLGARVNY